MRIINIIKLFFGIALMAIALYTAKLLFFDFSQKASSEEFEYNYFFSDTYIFIYLGLCAFSGAYLVSSIKDFK
jgi:hypothetical protein